MADEQLQKIITQLTDHEARLQRLESSKSKNKVKVTLTPQKRSGKGEDLHPPIQKLIGAGFFNEAKIDIDVVSELQRKLLTRKKPLRPSVVNVLRSLVRVGALERAEVVQDKKKLIAYKKA